MWLPSIRTDRLSPADEGCLSIWRPHCKWKTPRHRSGGAPTRIRNGLLHSHTSTPADTQPRDQPHFTGEELGSVEHMVDVYMKENTEIPEPLGQPCTQLSSLLESQHQEDSWVCPLASPTLMTLTASPYNHR